MIVLILIGTLIVFLPCLNAQFLTWDDLNHIVNNPAVRSFDFNALITAFTEPVQKVYIPLTTLTWSIEHALFGFNPVVFHINNLLLHLLNAYLIYLLAKRLQLSEWASLIAVMIFAWHPTKVESVVWLTERKDVLCAFFYLATIHAWITFRLKQHKAYFIVAIVFAILSLLAKPMAISLPFILILIDWKLMQQVSWRYVVDKAVFFGLSVTLGWLTYQHHVRMPIDDFLMNISVWCYTIIYYPIKFFVPLYLTPLNVLPNPITLTNPIYWLSMCAVIGIIVSLWVWRKKTWYVFAWAFYGLSMFFLWRFDDGHDITVVADRFMYIPSIGACLAIGFFVGRYHDHIKRFAFIPIALLAILTINYIPVWHDSISLFTHALEVNPNHPVALNNRAESYVRIKTYDLAIADYNKILTIKKDDVDTFYNRGLTYLRSGRYQLAINDFNKVIEQYPKYPRGYLQRGITLYKMGLYLKALDDFNMTISLSPDDQLGYFNRGLTNQRLGFDDLAIADYSNAIKYHMKNSSVFNNRGVLYAKKGLRNLALEDFNEALKIDPLNEEALFNRKLLIIKK